MLRHALRIASQKFDNSVVAQVQIPSTTQIEDACQRHYRVHRVVMGSQCQCQLSTGRMSEDDDAADIDGIFSCQLTERLVARSHIFEAARPSSPGIADASIFNVPCDEARLSQSAAGKAGMREVVASAPETSVDKHCGRKMSRAFGQAQIAELVFVISVPQASASWRRSIG